MCLTSSIKLRRDSCTVIGLSDVCPMLNGSTATEEDVVDVIYIALFFNRILASFCSMSSSSSSSKVVGRPSASVITFCLRADLFLCQTKSTLTASFTVVWEIRCPCFLPDKTSLDVLGHLCPRMASAFRRVLFHMVRRTSSSPESLLQIAACVKSQHMQAFLIAFILSVDSA